MTFYLRIQFSNLFLKGNMYIWDEIKNENKHHKLKRYIQIQFKKFGVHNFNDIVNITNNDEDYLYILYAIILYYSMKDISIVYDKKTLQ